MSLDRLKDDCAPSLSISLLEIDVIRRRDAAPRDRRRICMISNVILFDATIRPSAA